MVLRITNQVDVAVMIGRLNNLLGTNEKGEVTIDSIDDLDTCGEILATCIGFSNKIIERQRYAITREAVLDAKRKRRFDANAILANIEERQKDYLRQPIRSFVILTSASFRFWSKMRAIKLNDSKFVFIPTRPKNYPLPDGGSLIVKDNTPHDYCYLKVQVSARDPYQAAELAFRRVDLLRPSGICILTHALVSG